MPATTIPQDQPVTITAAVPPTAAASPEHQHQHVIRFHNQHYVWNYTTATTTRQNEGDLSLNEKENVSPLITPEAVLAYVSQQTRWPAGRLQIAVHTADYTAVRTTSCIRGGKGGFGSLLKSQSRQSGAKSTTNFDACRDLQGRRLRAVNTAAAASHFAAWQQRIDAGQATVEDMVQDLMKSSPAGIPGWHLQLPSWADIGKKETRQWKRQYQVWQQQRKQAAAVKQHKQQQRESAVQHYIQQSQTAEAAVQASVQTALQQGLAAQRAAQEEPPSKRVKTAELEEPPTAFLTLTGDFVLAPDKEKQQIWQLQSKSNFATFGIVLDSARLEQTSKNACCYYEVRFVTGGLCQVGWALPTSDFRPNSEEGDGVGDDAYSYAYDPSRALIFHNGESTPYGPSASETAVVVGCLWNRQQHTLSFSLNGTDLGVAYTLPSSDKEQDDVLVFPAVSANAKEIVQVHVHAVDMMYPPTREYCPVGDAMAKPATGDGAKDGVTTDPPYMTFALSAGDKKENTNLDSKPAAVETHGNALEGTTPQQEEAAKVVVPIEPLDLNDYTAVQELEALGLDRLKGALMAIGVKCGGTLTQRAERLWSLKGLDPKDFPPKLLAKKKKQ